MSRRINRLLFSYGNDYTIENHYMVGTTVGAQSRAVRRALLRRANNNAQGKPCCRHGDNNDGSDSDSGSTLDSPIITAETTLVSGDELTITITNYDSSNTYLWYQNRSLMDQQPTINDDGVAEVVAITAVTDSGTYDVVAIKDDLSKTSNTLDILVTPQTLGQLLQRLGKSSSGQVRTSNSQGQFLNGGAVVGYNMIAVKESDFLGYPGYVIEDAPGFNNIKVIQFANIPLQSMTSSAEGGKLYYVDSTGNNFVSTYTVTFLPISYIANDFTDTIGSTNYEDSIFYANASQGTDGSSQNNNDTRYVLLTGVVVAPGSDFNADSVTSYVPTNADLSVQYYNQTQVIKIGDDGAVTLSAWYTFMPLGFTPRLVSWMRVNFSNNINYTSMLQLAYGTDISKISFSSDATWQSSYTDWQNTNNPAGSTGSQPPSDNDVSQNEPFYPWWPLLLNFNSDDTAAFNYDKAITYNTGNFADNTASYTYRIGYSTIEIPYSSWSSLTGSQDENPGFFAISTTNDDNTTDLRIFMPLSVYLGTGDNFDWSANYNTNDAPPQQGESKLDTSLVIRIEYELNGESQQLYYNIQSGNPTVYPPPPDKSTFFSGVGNIGSDVNINEDPSGQKNIALVVFKLPNMSTEDGGPSYGNALSPAVPALEGTTTSDQLIKEQNTIKSALEAVLNDYDDKDYNQRYVANPASSGQTLLYTYWPDWNSTGGSQGQPIQGLLNAIFLNNGCWFNPVSFDGSEQYPTTVPFCLHSDVTRQLLIDSAATNGGTIPPTVELPYAGGGTNAQNAQYNNGKYLQYSSTDKLYKLATGLGNGRKARMVQYNQQDFQYFPDPGYLSQSDYQKLAPVKTAAQYDIYGSNMTTATNSPSYIGNDIVAIEQTRYEYFMKHYNDPQRYSTDIISIRPYNQRFTNGLYGFRVGNLLPQDSTNYFTNTKVQSNIYPSNITGEGIFFVPIQWFNKLSTNGNTWNPAMPDNANDEFGIHDSVCQDSGGNLRYVIGVLVCSAAGTSDGKTAGSTVLVNGGLGQNPFNNPPSVQLSTLSQHINHRARNGDDGNWNKTYGTTNNICTYFNQIITQYFGNCTLIDNFAPFRGYDGTGCTLIDRSDVVPYYLKGPFMNGTESLNNDTGWQKVPAENNFNPGRNIGLYLTNLPAGVTAVNPNVSSVGFGSTVGGAAGQTDGCGGTAYVTEKSIANPITITPADAAEGDTITTIYAGNQSINTPAFDINNDWQHIPGTAQFMSTMRKS